jgi:hypothetical protein
MPRTFALDMNKLQQIIAPIITVVVVPRGIEMAC